MTAQNLVINLLPDSARSTRSGGRFLDWALTYGRYIIIVTELIVLLAFFSRFKFDQELTDLHESIQHKQAVITSVADFEREVRSLQERIKKIAGLEQDHALYLTTIGVLNDIMPADVILSTLSFKGKSVTLKAIAYSRRGIASFLSSLKTAKLFSAVNLGPIEQSEDINGPVAVQITMDLIPQE